MNKYNLSYPLDINGFVSILGFEVRFVDTGNCDAYTIIVNGQKLMLLNQQLESQSRINFTLAHELGHYFIPDHMEPIYACNIDELVGNRTVIKKEEKEADLFASEILLPSKFIEKKSIRRLQDIISVAQTYNTSIPATAIKMMDYTYDNVAFVCCINGKIEWFAKSLGFKENHLFLKDLTKLSIPGLSLMNKCIENTSTISKGKIPAYVWLENMDSSSYIQEEVLYYPNYKTGYILISADDLI